MPIRTSSSPGFSQSYNRYSYGFNNPLSGTDPSGYGWARDFIGAAHDSFKNPTDIRKSYYAFSKRPDGGAQDRFMMRNSWARSLSHVAAAYIPFAGWAVSSYLSGYDVCLAGGGQREIKNSWLISVGTAAAFYGVGSATEAVGTAYGEGAAFAFNVAGHAAVGCASASAGGGSCGQGALSAGFGAAAGGINTGSGFGDFMVAMVAGGIGAELGGGKFENGAVTAAFGYLFNQAMHDDAFSNVDAMGNPLSFNSQPAQVMLGLVTTTAAAGALYVAGVGAGAYFAGARVAAAWESGTFGSSIDSAAYHYGKHGIGQGVSVYTKDAITFFRANVGRGTPHPLKSGGTGIKIRTSKEYGIYTKDGKIVTYGPR